MRKLVILGALLLALAGCASTPSSRPGVYVVERGDTLYSIAWRHGVDYRTLARLNHIEPPYVIHPGQRLRVSSPRPRTTADNHAAPGAPRALARYTGRVKPEPLAPYPVRQPEPLAKPTYQGNTATASNDAPRSAAPPPARREPPPSPSVAVATPRPPAEPAPRPSPSSQPARQATAAPSTPAASSPASSRGAKIVWQWPSDGPVVKPYTASADGKRGINIGGQVGQPVKAAARGRVVYSGSGLRGYGNLIIIKHDGSYLTAYGYNSELLVREGDVVNAGQRIASMGVNADRQPALHFELRRDGQPVDPLQYLPRR